MSWMRAKWLVMMMLVGSVALPVLAQAVDFDVVYVRQPRHGDDVNTVWPEVFHPARAEPGVDLMLLHPDGSEEVLVAGGNGAVTDPVSAGSPSLVLIHLCILFGLRI